MLTKPYTICYPKQNEHMFFLVWVCVRVCKPFNWVEFLTSFLGKLIWAITADIPKDGCPLTVPLLSEERSLIPDDMCVPKPCSWPELTNSMWRPLIQAGTLKFSPLGIHTWREKAVIGSHWQGTAVRGQHRVLRGVQNSLHSYLAEPCWSVLPSTRQATQSFLNKSSKPKRSVSIYITCKTGNG